MAEAVRPARVANRPVVFHCHLAPSGLELAGCVGRCRYDAALVSLAADHHGFADERRVEELFHGDEEGVHVDVEVGGHFLMRNLSGIAMPLPCLCTRILMENGFT